MGSGPCRGAAGHLHRRRARSGQVAARGGDRLRRCTARARSCCSGPARPSLAVPTSRSPSASSSCSAAPQSGALADCMPDSAAELLRLTPLVWRHRPELTAPDGDGGDHRRELFDAIAALLHAVGEERPVVCVLEDLHWAGAAHPAAARPRGAAVGRGRGCCCCARTARPRRTAADDLTYAIADLYRLDGVRRLDLAGLSVEEVAQYLVAEGGLSVRRAREYATVLRDQTGGNPFFLRELWRDLAGSDVFTGAGPAGCRREPSAPGRRSPSGTRCSGGCPGWRRASAPWWRPRPSWGTAVRCAS